MARYCLEPACPEVVSGRANYCTSHDPWTKRPAWQGSASGRHRAGSSGWAWSRIRRRILRRDNHRCACGRPAAEVDHVVPVAECLRQGTNPDEESNLRAICADCHRAKTEQDRRRGRRTTRER